MKKSIIYINNLEQARDEISKIGSWGRAIDIMVPKAMNICIKVYDIGSWEANIIKQEMLSKGGEVAVHKEVCRLDIEQSDILIIGNIAQYKRLIQKLLIQPGELKNIAEGLSDVIENIETPKPAHIVCGTHSISVGKKVIHIYSRPINQLLAQKDDIGQDDFDIFQIDFMQSDEPEIVNILPQLIDSLKMQLKKPIAIKTNSPQHLKIAIKNGIDCIHTIGTNIISNLDGLIKYNLGIIVACVQQKQNEELIASDEKLIAMEKMLKY